MSAPSQPAPAKAQDEHPLLPIAEVGLANKTAQIRGTISGISIGIIAALVTRNLLKASPNTTLLTGLLSGTTSGYVASRYQLQQGLSDVERSEKLRRGVLAPPTNVKPGSSGSGTANSSFGGAAETTAQGSSLVSELRAADETHFEAGVGGMHEFVDRGATTRGDH